MSANILVSRVLGIPIVDVSTTTIDPTQGAFAVANNLRVASLSIAAYDYFLTLAAELRLYKNSSSRRSLGFILFILIRYTSMIVMFTSNFGFFYHHFTPIACSRYCYVAPVFKVIQIMVSQAILGIRTYNIAQRNARIGRIVASAYSLASVFLWFTALYDRQAEITDGNCMTGSAHPDQTVSAWSFYLVAMLYDFLVLSISTHHLLKLRASATISTSSKLLNILLYDGLGYFVALTAINMVNIILYRGVGGAIQSSGASMEYAAIWIMSQRILLHLREVRAQQASVVAIEQIPRPSPITSASHLHKSTYRNRPDGNLSVNVGNDYDTALSDFNVEVRIERTIIRDDKPLDEESTAERDLYTPPKSDWDGNLESEV